ncbi:stage III sporulation protein AE [Tissierella creatinini]|nr:stage III sporulation protein AE [Tissierella creatinini]TJX69089.1 stage III sporulation protein AE [Soehngenia saccharolytica]
MKRTIYILLLILIIPTIVVGADIEGFIIEEQLDMFDTQELESFIEDVLKENEAIKGFNFKDIIKQTIKGERIFNKDALQNFIVETFFSEIKVSLGFLAKIIAITMISALITNLQGTFENSSVSQIANYVTYMVLAILILGSFYQLMEVVKVTIVNMVRFMEIIMPILLTFLVIAGGPNTKVLFHPMIIGSVNLIGVLVQNIIIPLIYFSFIVSILANLSQRAELKKISELGRQVITFIITAAFTIFIGIITIYGLSTKMDGITIRTAKFAIDNFVPIVGGFLSDAVETVIGSSAILKNGIGIIGLVILIIITVLPVIKISVLLFIYKVISAVIEPIVSSNISNFFTDISKTLLLILISLVSVSIMFFITITIIVDTGNSLIMLR